MSPLRCSLIVPQLSGYDGREAVAVAGSPPNPPGYIAFGPPIQAPTPPNPGPPTVGGGTGSGGGGGVVGQAGAYADLGKPKCAKMFGFSSTADAQQYFQSLTIVSGHLGQLRIENVAGGDVSTLPSA
jgi:hypothetical protein